MKSMIAMTMHHLLCKEILYEPMKEIGIWNPKWLKVKKDTISNDDYEHYSNQYKLINDLINYMSYNQTIWENSWTYVEDARIGQPSSDIVQDLAPGLDLWNNWSQAFFF